MLKMNYTASNSSTMWYCEDGYTIPEPDVTATARAVPVKDEVQNCYLINSLSNNTVKAGKGYFKVSFMRPFGTDDTSEEDIQLERGSNVAAQVRMKWPGEDRATYTTIELPDIDNSSASRLTTIALGLISLLLISF